MKAQRRARRVSQINTDSFLPVAPLSALGDKQSCLTSVHSVTVMALTFSLLQQPFLGLLHHLTFHLT